MTVLRTARLILSPVLPGDMQHFLKFYANPEVMAVRKYGVLDPDTARRHVEIMLDHWSKHGYGMWVLRDTKKGVFVGECGIRWQDDSPDLELSYGLHPDFRRRGLASEAAQAVVAHARDTLGLPRIAAMARADNHISHRILEKLGMTLVWRSSDREPPLVKYAMDL